MTVSIVSKSAITKPTSVATSKTAGLFVMLLGSAFVFLIGFSHVDAVHDAAHDTRHANGFPCH